MLIVIVLIVLFLTASGIMAAVDAALLSVTEPEILELIVKKRRGAKRLNAIRQQLTRAVVVVVILTNLINVVGPIIVSQQAVLVFGTEILAVITVTLTLGTIVCSEIIPKSVGNRYATTIGRFAATPIHWMQFVLFPLVIVLEWLSDKFTRGTRRIGTEEQIRSLATLGRRAGYIEHDESHLIHRAFVLNDRSAADIMTPLERVVSLPASLSVSDAVAKLRTARFSRVPLFGESANDVRGIVLVRDLLEATIHDSSVELVSQIALPAVIVDANTRSDELLPELLKRRIHLAVVQRDGKTIGVVSLENVLEELVGDIKDERDTGCRSSS
jgi:putative hemolysin